METQPLISVITITFNAEKEVGKTLQSLKSQTYQDFEYLVIDGNSYDSTLSIVKKFNFRKLKILAEPDEGLYDAMNKGLKLAKGKYVLFLNAGDAFHTSDTLAHYAEKALEDFDIIYGDTVIVDKRGDLIGPRHLSVPDKLTKESFSEGMLICHQAFMVKKELVPFYDLRYHFSADYDWCVKCIDNSDPKKCFNLGEVTIDYLSDGLTDKNKMKSLRERFRIMAKHYGMAKTVRRHIGFVGRALRRVKTVN